MKKLIVLGLLMSVSAFATTSYTITRVSGTYTVLSGNELHYLTGDNYTVTMPTCSSLTNNARYYTFKNIEANPTTSVTIVGAGSSTIDGASGLVLVPTQSATLHCDGQNATWRGIAVY